MRYLLDTDAVVDVLRRRHEVAKRLAAVSPDDVRVSAVTVADLAFGALNSRDPGRNRAETEKLLAQISVAAFGARAAAEHARIRHALRAAPIGPNDLVIAATAVAIGATLVTANTREFGRVPGLAVENWRPERG